MQKMKLKKGVLTGRNFDINEQIKACSLQTFWTLDAALAFGHVALKVARDDAITEQDQRAAGQYRQWERTAELAASAHTALNAFVRCVPKGGLSTGVFMGRTRVDRKFAKSGVIKLLANPRIATNGKMFGRDDAKHELASLTEALHTLKTIREHATVRCKELRHTKKIKDADYGKRVFVLRLAEAWIYLTGNLPGKGRTAEKNPFLRFVGAALSDVGDEDEEDSFRALEWALEHLKQITRFSEVSQQSISVIAAKGPVWFEGTAA